MSSTDFDGRDTPSNSSGFSLRGLASSRRRSTANTMEMRQFSERTLMQRAALQRQASRRSVPRGSAVATSINENGEMVIDDEIENEQDADIFLSDMDEQSLLDAVTLIKEHSVNAVNGVITLQRFSCQEKYNKMMMDKSIDDLCMRVIRDKKNDSMMKVTALSTLVNLSKFDIKYQRDLVRKQRIIKFCIDTNKENDEDLTNGLILAVSNIICGIHENADFTKLIIRDAYVFYKSIFDQAKSLKDISLRNSVAKSALDGVVTVLALFIRVKNHILYFKYGFDTLLMEIISARELYDFEVQRFAAGILLDVMVRLQFFEAMSSEKRTHFVKYAADIIKDTSQAMRLKVYVLNCLYGYYEVLRSDFEIYFGKQEYEFQYESDDSDDGLMTLRIEEPNRQSTTINFHSASTRDAAIDSMQRSTADEASDTRNDAANEEDEEIDKSMEMSLLLEYDIPNICLALCSEAIKSLDSESVDLCEDDDEWIDLYDYTVVCFEIVGSFFFPKKSMHDISFQQVYTQIMDFFPTKPTSSVFRIVILELIQLISFNDADDVSYLLLHQTDIYQRVISTVLMDCNVGDSDMYQSLFDSFEVIMWNIVENMLNHEREDLLVEVLFETMDPFVIKVFEMKDGKPEMTLAALNLYKHFAYANEELVLRVLMTWPNTLKLVNVQTWSDDRTVTAAALNTLGNFCDIPYAVELIVQFRLAESIVTRVVSLMDEYEKEPSGNDTLCLEGGLNLWANIVRSAGPQARAEMRRLQVTQLASSFYAQLGDDAKCIKLSTLLVVAYLAEPGHDSERTFSFVEQKDVAEILVEALQATLENQPVFNYLYELDELLLGVHGISTVHPKLLTPLFEVLRTILTAPAKAEDDYPSAITKPLQEIVFETLSSMSVVDPEHDYKPVFKHYLRQQKKKKNLNYYVCKLFSFKNQTKFQAARAS